MPATSWASGPVAASAAPVTEAAFGRKKEAAIANAVDDGERGGKTGKHVRSSIQVSLKSGAQQRLAGILLVLPTEEAAIRKARRLGQDTASHV